MKAVQATPTNLSRGNFHFEAFTATDYEANPFAVKIASSGQTYDVAPGHTILEVLRTNGVSVSSSCETGSCGTCVTGYIEGTVVHHDFCLSSLERKSKIAVCVSRAATGSLTLDL